MEKSSTSANSTNMVCKRILNAFADFQKILPFSSPPRQYPPATHVSSPENPNSREKDSSPPKVAGSKPKSTTIKQEIPVLTDPPPPAAVQMKKTTEESKIEPKFKAHDKQGKHDKFTDYINEAKVKMRSSSDMGEKLIDKRSDATRKDDPKDKFSNYISRAGNRIRTSSSKVGFGKATLVKAE